MVVSMMFANRHLASRAVEICWSVADEALLLLLLQILLGFSHFFQSTSVSCDVL